MCAARLELEKLTLCERLFLMECDMPFESVTTVASVDAGEEVGTVDAMENRSGLWRQSPVG